MVFHYTFLDFSFEIEDGFIHNIIIENEKILTKFIVSIINAIENEDTDLLILDKDRPLSFSKYAYICLDFFNINLNEKRFLTAAYQQLQSIINNDNELYLQSKKLFTDLFAFLESVVDSSDFEFSMNPNFLLTSLFKLFELKIEDQGDSILEKLIEYISLISKVTPNAFLFLVNSKIFFDENDCVQIFKHALNMGIHLVLIEGSCKYNIKSYEKNFIIDKDLCIL